MIPNRLLQRARIRRKLAYMLAQYQEKGVYRDADGVLHTTVRGIVAVWIELDQFDHNVRG